MTIFQNQMLKASGLSKAEFKWFWNEGEKTGRGEEARLRDGRGA